MTSATLHTEGAIRVDAALVGGFEPPPQDATRSNAGVELRPLLGEQTGNPVAVMWGRIAPRCEISREVHDSWSETLYVLSGEASCTVGDAAAVAVRAGQLWHVRPTFPHVVRNLGDEPVEFLILFGA